MDIATVIKWLLKKQTVAYAALVGALIIFHSPIEGFLTCTFVDYLFHFVESTWYNDVVFILILLFAVIVTGYRCYIGYYPSRNFLRVLAFTSVVYIFYRFIYVTVWEFVPFSFCGSIKYTDVIFFIPLLSFLLFIEWKWKIEKSIKSENGFFDDEPLGENKKDELGYTSYAKLLAIKIKESRFKKAFAIGINGKWGIGKTSFIDILKKNLNDESIIEINFNSWNSNSPQAIIKDFFETFQEKISPFHSSLSRLLITYSEKLVSLNDNTVTQSIQTSVNLITGFDSLSSLFESINDTLKKIDKKIIIYIDDLDRLDKNEIVEVIRLIRNTANFYNTFFIVAYDRNYVINALKKHNQYKEDRFLEKIFQVEITLPYFDKNVYRRKLAEKLKEKIDKEFHKEIESSVLGSTINAPLFLNEWLESMRDVTRLANAIILNWSKLQKEVVFSDLLRLELLRIKYPSVYELLFRNTEQFLHTERSGSSGRENYYQLNRIDEERKKNLTEDSFKSCDKEIDLYLRKNYSELSIPFNDIEKIVRFLDGIFGGGSWMFSLDSISHLSIIYPSKFNRYFAYSLLEDSLSEIEFGKARELNQDEFNAQITKWVDDGLEYELQSRFVEIKNFDSQEDFEKVINAIFYLARQQSKKGTLYTRGLVSYEGSNLFEKLNNYGQKIVKQLYNGDEEAYKNFLKQVFKSAPSPFLYEISFIRLINHYGHFREDSFPLSKEELDKIAVGYLKEYIESVSKIDSNVWVLFNECTREEMIPVGNGNSYRKAITVLDDAKTIMREFILSKDLDGFIKQVIEADLSEEERYRISNYSIFQLFNDWATFKKELDKQDEGKWSYLKEFKAFWIECEKVNFSAYVKFVFEVIAVKKPTVIRA